MSRAGSNSEMPVQDRLLLDKRSLEMNAPELGQPLSYLLYLRSCWKPEGRAKLVVPTSWMQFLTFTGVTRRECNRHCPFRAVRFDSVAEAGPEGLVASNDQLPRDMVSRLLADHEMDSGGLETLVPIMFEGVPRTRLRSAARHIDFAVSAQDENDELDAGALLLGMKAQRLVDAASPSDSRSIPEKLTVHGRFHLTRLASLVKTRVAGTECFPEWLVLFGLIYDAHYLRIVAYLPRRCRSDAIGCTAYIVDDLSLHTPVADASGCELALERLRFLLALITLRRHVHRLSRTLYAHSGSADDSPSLPRASACNQDDCDSLATGSSRQDCNSEYSTCPSSICNEQDLCSSFDSSSCSTCSSSLESTCISNSWYSDDSRYTNSRTTQLSMISLAQRGNKSVTCPNKFTETKRREIIAWAREVIPTEHPVKDTYRMIPILGSQESQTANQVHADRHYQLYV